MRCSDMPGWGHREIVYRQVSAAPAHGTPRLHGAPQPGRAALPPCSTSTSLRSSAPGGGYPTKPSATAFVARDVAADIVALLRSGAEIDTRAADGERLGTASIAPGDVAVLVRSHRQADLVAAELEALGVPAVINGSGSVFATPAASDWLKLLDALEQPSRETLARTAALTPLLGWSATQLSTASDSELGAAAPPPARLGADAARQRLRDPGRIRPLLRPGQYAAARAGRRRAPADGPASRRAAAARSRQRRPSRRLGADQLAARARGRGRRRPRWRGAHPPVGLRRRRRPGADDPLKQGARVPGRLLPVRVGRPASARRPPPAPVPRRRHARDRRLARGTGVRGARRAAAARGARRGPAPALRRADPRAPPGGDLVGRPPTTPTSRRWGACCSRRSPAARSPGRAGAAHARTRRWRALRRSPGRPRTPWPWSRRGSRRPVSSTTASTPTRCSASPASSAGSTRPGVAPPTAP